MSDYDSRPETQERDMALRMFGKALDIVTGKQSSAVPVERWVRLRAIRAGESAGMAPCVTPEICCAGSVR